MFFSTGNEYVTESELRIQLKLNTALLSTVRPCVTGVTSHIFHIYKSINAMLSSGEPSSPIPSTATTQYSLVPPSTA